MTIIESLKLRSFLQRPSQGSQKTRWVLSPGFRTSICAAVLGAAGAILVGKFRRYIVFSVSDEGSSLTSSWVVPGLQNLGNNCFLNVILQALASCSWFRKYVKEISEEYELSSNDDEDLPLVCELASLVEELNIVRHRSTVLSPRRLMLAMAHYIPNFNLTKQQDAEEALSHLLSSLREEVSQHYAQNGTCLTNLSSLSNGRFVATKGAADEESEFKRWRRTFLNPFDGILGSFLSCQTCSFQISLDFQLFHTLHLSIPTASGVYNIIGECTLDRCLKKFFSAEYVENYHCSNCWYNAAIKYASVFAEDKRDIEKLQHCNKYDPCDCKSLPSLEAFRWSNRFSRTLTQLSLAKTPKILCIHLQRASYNILGQSVKVLDHVSFPLILDLSPLVTNSLGLHNIESNSRFSPPTQNPKVDPIYYRLVSVIVHYGTSGGGHYTVYRKATAKIGDGPASLLESVVEQWFCISDSQVHSVSEGEVLDASATILFYEKFE